MINQGKMQEAADELLKWCHAAGKEYDGLLARRKAERELFLMSN
jgi:GH24 family phage-related lysozyme (muramidase)